MPYEKNKILQDVYNELLFNVLLNNSFNRRSYMFYPGNVYRFDVFIISFRPELSIKISIFFKIICLFR